MKTSNQYFCSCIYSEKSMGKKLKDINIGITLSASYGPPPLLSVPAIMSVPYVTLGYVMILTQGHMCKFKVPGRKSA